MFTFCLENRFPIGQSTKILSVKTGFEELKKSKQTRQLIFWCFGSYLLKTKRQNMRWTGHICYFCNECIVFRSLWILSTSILCFYTKLLLYFYLLAHFKFWDFPKPYLDMSSSGHVWLLAYFLPIATSLNTVTSYPFSSLLL